MHETLGNGPAAIDGDRLLTTREAMEALRTSRTQLHRLTSTGAIPSIKAGYRKLLFRESDLRQFIADRTRVGH